MASYNNVPNYRREIEPTDEDLALAEKRREAAARLAEEAKKNDPVYLLQQALEKQREEFKQQQQSAYEQFQREQATLAQEASDKLAREKAEWETRKAEQDKVNETRRAALEAEGQAKTLYIEQQRKKMQEEREAREALALKKAEDQKQSTLASARVSLGDRSRQEGFLRELVAKEDVRATTKDDEEFEQKDTKQTFLERILGKNKKGG